MVNHKPYFQAIQNYTHVVSGVVVAFFEVFLFAYIFEVVNEMN